VGSGRQESGEPATRSRDGIRAWVADASRDAGRRLLGMAPSGIVAVLTASALVPIALPLRDATPSALTEARPFR
jgi:hypothetical protein